MYRDNLCCGQKTIMSWDLLPIDLRVLILSFRHEMRVNTCATIQKWWKKFQAPKNVAKMLCSTFGGFGVMHPDTADIMEYCVKVLSGKENPKFWNMALDEVDYKLWVDEYSGGPGAPYKFRTGEAYHILTRRFGHPSSWQITSSK